MSWTGLLTINNEMALKFVNPGLLSISIATSIYFLPAALVVAISTTFNIGSIAILIGETVFTNVDVESYTLVIIAPEATSRTTIVSDTPPEPMTAIILSSALLKAN